MPALAVENPISFAVSVCNKVLDIIKEYRDFII